MTVPDITAICSSSYYQLPKIRILAKSEPSYDNTLAYMILDLDSSYQHLLLAATVYMRPHCTKVASFFTTLSIFSNKYNHIVLTGDLNHNLLASNNSEITMFRKHVENLSLCIVPSEPTHHPMTKDGVKYPWLDLFIVDKLNSVVNYCKSTTPFIIAHDLIEINYKFCKPPAVIRSFTSRHLNRINDHNLLTTLTPKLVDMTTHAPVDANVHQLTDSFFETLLNCFNEGAPLRLYTVSARSRPWVSPEMRELIAQRDRAYRRACDSENDHDIANYRQLRSQIKRLIDDSEEKYIV
ncbi:hypothetical protein TKK_0014684 [Trichogramma kaykai]|uniref:Endonuclease/exonuclease/phosphatase domain-containing protein n=1 Tax=Trichogramma kaykai TaxID=54128 RepID=A0ABD2WD74_9HYME